MSHPVFTEEQNQAFKRLLAQGDFGLVEQEVTVRGERQRVVLSASIVAVLQAQEGIRQLLDQAAAVPPVPVEQFPPEPVLPAPSPGVAGPGVLAEVDTYLTKRANSGAVSVRVQRAGVLRRLYGEHTTEGDANNATGVRFWLSQQDRTGTPFNPDFAIDDSVFADAVSDTAEDPYVAAGNQVTAAGFTGISKFDIRLSRVVDVGQFLTLDVIAFTSGQGWAAWEIEIAGVTESGLIGQSLLASSLVRQSIAPTGAQPAGIVLLDGQPVLAASLRRVTTLRTVRAGEPVATVDRLSGQVPGSQVRVTGSHVTPF